MKPKFLKSQLALVAAAFVTMAASPTPGKSPEDMLKSAGFQAKRAETKEQKEQLRKLPDRKMCVVSENGKKHYVYADQKHNQIYMGDENKHQKFYQGLRQIGGADAIGTKVYDNRGNPFQVNTFTGFGPWPGD